MIHRQSPSDPRHLGAGKPVLVCDQRLRAQSSTGRPSRKEADSRENHDRQQLQLSRRGCLEAPWRPSEAPRRPSHLDTKAVILESEGQQHVGKSSPVRRTQAGKRADIVTLRRHLDRARRLASAIKRGQSYFQLLQKEEQEEREEEVRQRMRREEQLRTEPRPPSFSSDSDSDSEGCPLPAGTSWSGVNVARPRRKKSQSARPFTPVHHSLTSPLLSEAPRKVIYRQLCCLNWLLEALTLDRSGRVCPLTACWDPKDPGRGRTTIKTLKKERAIETQWEQFASNKPRRAHPRRPRSSSARLHTHRRSSFMSVASLSALTSTTVGSSLSSLVPGAEEDTESPAAAEETDRPPSENIQLKVKKERRSPQSSSLGDSLTAESKTQPLPQRTDDQTGSKTAKSFLSKSCPARPPLAISQPINNKASMLRELKAAFEERAEEMAQSYVDVLELKARERLNNGLQKYQALCHMTEPHGLPRHVTRMSQETWEAANNNNKNKHSNNMWLSTLLSSLPEEVCRERAVSRVLEKLSGFAERPTLRVRPQLFLKVLGGLEPWELCLPELCVAVQIATEHVVQMPREEYDAWLRSRVTLPNISTVALKHQVNHIH